MTIDEDERERERGTDGPPDHAEPAPDEQTDSKIPAPFAPDDEDDTPLGDTDQHSDA